MKGNRVTYSQTTAASLLTLFLITSILSVFFNSLEFQDEQGHLVITSKAIAKSHQDDQLPYEGKEKESESEAENKIEDRSSHYFLIACFDFKSLSHFSGDVTKFQLESFQSSSNMGRFPIYLSTLSLRI